uniref:Uncharacterized protein n=1 Tax=Arion vulgaris TaxID=1028688 RepID=A0A0B6YQN5_9EUPU
MNSLNTTHDDQEPKRRMCFRGAQSTKEHHRLERGQVCYISVAVCYDMLVSLNTAQDDQEERRKVCFCCCPKHQGISQARAIEVKCVTLELLYSIRYTGTLEC